MKPGEIIYWNQYSGLTEFCRRSEMIHTKNLEIYNQHCETKRVVEAIFSEGYFTFEIRDKDLRIFADPFMKALYASGKPMMSDFTVIMSCTFTMVEYAEEFIDFKLTEIINGAPPVEIGYVKIHRNITKPINGKKCKGAIIIHDVQMGKGSALTLQALGVFAMGVGLYLLSYMSDWKSIGNILNKHLVPQESKIDELNQKLSASNAKIFELQEILEAERNENSSTIRKLQSLVREQNLQIANLTEKIQKLETSANNKKSELPPMNIDNRDYVTEFQEKLSGKKLCIVGGNSNWQKKFLENFPDTAIIDKDIFDESQVRSADLVIVNTNFIGHSCTKKVVDIASQAKIRVCYTEKNNLASMAQDLIEKIEVENFG